MNAVIYARYSSSAQTEQSIEGQIRVCKEYAETNGIKIINEYIDRAMTGTNDNRPAFLQMIEDSKKKQFEKVIVYKLDRFSRNRYDNAIYKHLLEQNGVKVISATEVIGDTPEGKVIESLLEAFAELYSKDLSQKVKRGLRESVLKGNFTGGNILYGYKVENRKILIHEENAKAVKIMFEEYAKGTSKVEIVKMLNELGYRTNKGKKFCKNSINNYFTNKKYIGYYKNAFVESSTYYPAIISVDLFEQVQEKLNHNQRYGRKSKETFILCGKLYCGNCCAKMIGTSGTSKTCKIHSYYTCLERNKRHTCDKSNENKQKLEDDIIAKIKEKVLHPVNIELIATNILQEYNSNINTLKINEYKAKIKEIDKQLDNITNQFIATKNQKILERLNKHADDLTELQETYEKQIKKITLATSIKHTKEDIKDYLNTLIFKNEEDIQDKQRLIDTFVNSIYVFDDYYNIYIDIIDKHPPTTFEEAKRHLNLACKEFAHQSKCSTIALEKSSVFFIAGVSNPAGSSVEPDRKQVAPRLWLKTSTPACFLNASPPPAVHHCT